MSAENKPERRSTRRQFLRRAASLAAGLAASAPFLGACGPTPTEKPVAKQKGGPTLSVEPESLEKEAQYLPVVKVAEKVVTVAPTVAPKDTEAPKKPVTLEATEKPWKTIDLFPVNLEGFLSRGLSQIGQGREIESLIDYTSETYAEKIKPEDLGKKDVQALKFVSSLVQGAGVENLPINLGRSFPEFGDLYLGRIRIDKLPNGDQSRALLDALPQGLVIRPGTHFIFAGIYEDKQGKKWGIGSFSEYFDREKPGFEPRGTPRQFLVILPQNVLEALINLQENGVSFKDGIISFKDEKERKTYQGKPNIIGEKFFLEVKEEVGVLWMGQKPNRGWYENPVVLKPDKEMVGENYVFEKATFILPEGGSEVRILAKHPITGEILAQARHLFNQETNRWEWKWNKIVEKTPTPPPAETPIPKPGAEIIVESLNLRKGPGINYDDIPGRSLKKGDKVEVIGQYSGWYLIRLDGQVAWISGNPQYVLANQQAKESAFIPQDKIPPTPTPRPPAAPAPTERAKTPVPEIVFAGNGWIFDNRNPEIVVVGLNPSFVSRLEELMRQYDTPSIRYIIYKECPPELGTGETRYCIGLKDGTTWGCPCRIRTEKGIVHLFPEPAEFYLLQKQSKEEGWSPERYYTAWLTHAIMGSKGPEMLPLFNELLARKAVVARIK